MKRLQWLGILGLFLGVSSAQPSPVPSSWAQRFVERQRQVLQRLQEAQAQMPPQREAALRRLRRAGLYTRGDTLFIRVLALRVEFQEDSTPLTTGNGKMRLTDNGESPTLTDPETGCEVPNPFYDPPHDKTYFEHQLEALAHWNYLASFGHVRLEWTVKPDADSAAYQLPHPMTYYGDTINWYEGLLALYRDALLVADQDTSVHFSQYSRVIVFHAGSAWQTDYLGDSPFDIAAVTVLGYPIPVDEGQDTIWDASVLPETMGQDGIEVKLQSTLIHESMHNFYYAPDLYDTGYPPTGIGIGAWGIMCTGPYLGIAGEIPEGMIVPLPNAFERWWMDWAFRKLYRPPLPGFLRPPLYQVLAPGTRPDTLQLLPSEVLTDSVGRFLEDPYRGPRIYRIPINEHEYWLVESKLDNLPQNDSLVCGDTVRVTPYYKDGVAVHVFGENDYLLPGKGLLIWHIDSLILFQNWYTNTVQVPRPMAVDLEEADHVQDLEHWTDNLQYTVYGSPYDPWFQGNPNTFMPFSSPSSCDNQGGQTGVSIYGFSPPGTLMTFVLRQAFELPGFPYSLYTSHQPGFVQAVDLDGDDTLEILVTASIGLDSSGQYIVEPPRIYALEPDLSPYGTGGPLKATLDPGFITGEPAVADLDQDGIAEILVPRALNFQGWIDVYSATPGNQFQLRTRIALNDGVLAAPAVVQDSLFAFGDAHARLFVANLQGQLLDTLQVGAPVRTTPAVLQDGSLVFQSADALLYLWNPFTDELDTLLSNAFVVETFTSPLVGVFAPDLPDAVVTLTRDGTLHLVALNGEVLWQRTFEDRPRTDLAVGDLNSDAVLDFVWLAGSRVYAVDAYGNLLSEFPVTVSGAESLRVSAPVIADFDPQVPGTEALFYLEHHGLVAVGPHGILEHGFPWAVEDSVIHTPVIADLDGFGPLPPAVFTLSATGTVHAYQVPGGEVVWPGFAGGPEHLGRVFYVWLPLPPAPPDFGRVYLYPNPTYTGKTRLRAEVYGSATARVQVFSPAGKRLKTLEVHFQGRGMTDGTPELDLSDLAPGVYWLNLRLEAGDRSVTRNLKLAILR